MKKLLAVSLFALPLLAMAADDVKKAPRTTKLGVCSKEAHAKGLKGDERKKFISGCIASSKQTKPAPAASTAP